MNNKGNRKHLTFEQRVEIEKALTENKSFAEIGRIIGKDSSTISKEVRLHARVKERPDPGYTNPPCIHRKKCKMTCLCDEQCGTMCKICKKQNMRCIDVCPAYETAECEKLKKPPYVCNGCAKKSHCLMPRMFYSSKYAHDEYRNVLVDSRVGINQTPESIQSMNDLLVPLIRDKHQSIGHIYATHAEELGCSRRTLYSYINDCVFDIRNGDLRRSVRYKKRRKPTKAGSKDRSYRQGHNYEDFQDYMKEHPDTNVVEMDCVEGKKGESRSILTFTFRNWHSKSFFQLSSRMEVLNSPPEKRWKNSVTEVKVLLSFTVIHTAFGKKVPVKRIMSISAIYVRKAVHSLI